MSVFLSTKASLHVSQKCLSAVKRDKYRDPQLHTMLRERMVEGSVRNKTCILPFKTQETLWKRGQKEHTSPG